MITVNTGVDLKINFFRIKLQKLRFCFDVANVNSRIA